MIPNNLFDQRKTQISADSARLALFERLRCEEEQTVGAPTAPAGFRHSRFDHFEDSLKRMDQ
jgi:hypothetical protein